MSSYNDGYNDYHCWPPESTSNTDEDELTSPEIEQGDSDNDTESSTSSTSTSATSSSDSSQSSSDSESTSTADEDDASISLKTEPALANKTELNLPVGMCEDEGVFKQIFSVNSWVCLSDQQKQHLKNFLPTFPENDLMEKELTLRMLFGGQSFRFGVNPIDEFQNKLKNGHFRPDIVKMKSLLRRSLKREYKKQQRVYHFNMLKKLLPSRLKVIEGLNEFSSTTTNIGASNSFTMHQQVRRRYFRELSDIKHLVGDDSEDSSDSNYQEGPPARLSKKQRRHLSVVQNSLSPEIETITSTLATYPQGIDLSNVALPMSNPFDPTEDMYREMLMSHRRKQKKIEQEQEQIQNNSTKDYTRKTVSLGSEKKRTVVSDRPRVKRTKLLKQKTQTVQPPLKLDIKPVVKLEELHNIPIKLEPGLEQDQSESNCIPYIKKEVLDKDILQPPLQLSPSPSPPPSSVPLSPQPTTTPRTPSPPSQFSLPISSYNSSPSPHVSLQEYMEQESINSIKIDSCNFSDDKVKTKEENSLPNVTIKVEPVSLTADEIRKAEEGQAAAAMLLEQMSDIEEKYDPPPLVLSPPPPPPSPSPPLPLEPESKNIVESKFSPPDYLTKREFHPEDMLTSTVQSIVTESPPRMFNSCLQALTPNDYGTKQLSLSPVSTPSKVLTDSNYVVSLSELEGFHVLDVKSECNEELNIKPLPATNKTTDSFFALVRDIICSTWEHRMTMIVLTECVQDWANSILNNLKFPDWYHSLASKTWPKALQSAIGFLAGHFPEWQPEDFVPFIEYKPNIDTYQWIGAGRDSDTRLGELCKCWLQNLNSISSKLNTEKEEVISCINLPVLSSTDTVSKTETPETDSSVSLPSPLLDTWIVTCSNAEERAVFQAQEKQRFLKPHRSFIYQMHGYESVVGPVRGIYNSSNIHKAARGHSLLIENRPHFISILVLVRDATARLPNGMGTRSDICTLLKDSQYLMEANQTDLHNAVSGALDRLHYENDPCVKYDPKRKIWIYLHRGRTIEEFERLHLEQQGAVKTKCCRRNKAPKTEPKRAPNKKPTSNVLLESLSMLDLPTNSTSDSMPSSSTSPVLSDVHLRVSQEIACLDNFKQTTKPPQNIKNQKISVQTTDNAFELNIKYPNISADQTRTEKSQLFAMPVSTITTDNSQTVTTGTINNPSTVGNISRESIFSSFTSQPVSIISNCHNIGNNVTSNSIISKSNISQSNIISISSQSVSSNIISQSIANSNILFGSTSAAVTNSGHMINKSQPMSSNSQTLVNNNKMKQIISSGDLITVGPKKKTTKNVKIAQPVSIGSSSGSSNLQQDNSLIINKLLQNKDLQRQILLLKQKLSDNSFSISEPAANVTNQISADAVKPQTVQQLFHLQQQKLQKQHMQLKLLQSKQIQQQTLQQNKQQVIIKKSDGNAKTAESTDGEHSQVIFVKQGPRGVQEAQQITQQQFQQLLMLRPQQQTGQQAQVVMVKKPGNDQKPIALKPMLTSMRASKIQQSQAKSTNLLLQTKQANQSVQHRITKPIVGKLVSSPRTQLSTDTVLANRKLPGVSQGTPLRISSVKTSNSGQPQYTVVTVAQPKLMPSNQLNIGQQTSTRLSNVSDRLQTSDTPQTVRVVQSKTGGKPVIVTSKAQISTALAGMPCTASNITSSSVVNSTANTYTVLQQGSQQILVPASSLKSIQGLKVIPLSQHSVKGRPQVFARLVNSDEVRPMFIQQPPNQDTGHKPSESNT